MKFCERLEERCLQLLTLWLWCLHLAEGRRLEHKQASLRHETQHTDYSYIGSCFDNFCSTVQSIHGIFYHSRQSIQDSSLTMQEHHTWYISCVIVPKEVDSKTLGHSWCAWHCLFHILWLLDTKIPMFITAGLKIVNMRKLIALSHVHHCLCILSSTFHHNNTATSKFCCCHTIYSRRLCSLHRIERPFQN